MHMLPKYLLHFPQNFDKLRQKSIVGEIYEMDEKQLPSLDKFESCPFLYNRETLTVVAGNGNYRIIFNCIF